MIENIRKYTGLMIVVLVLLFIGLVFLGDSAGNAFGSKPVMEVAGQSISQKEFQRNMAVIDLPGALSFSPLPREARIQASHYLGESIIDYNQLSPGQIVGQMSQFLQASKQSPGKFVANRINIQKAGIEYGVTPSNEEVEGFVENVLFADDEGNYDVEAYNDFVKNRITSFGGTKGFNDYIRDLLTGQNLSRLLGGGIAPEMETIRALYDNQKQVITAEQITIEPGVYEAKVNPSEEEIKAYYEENKANYNSDELRSISYVHIEPDWAEVLKAANLKKAEEAAKAEELRKKQEEATKKAQEAADKANAENSTEAPAPTIDPNASSMPTEPTVTEVVPVEAKALITKLKAMAVYFDSASAEIKASEEQKITEAAQLILESKDVAQSLTVGGYADLQGNADFNRTLSLKRANAVRDRLVSKGVPAARLSVNHFGEDTSKSAKDDLWKSRRVEISLTGPTTKTEPAESGSQGDPGQLGEQAPAPAQEVITEITEAVQAQPSETTTPTPGAPNSPVKPQPVQPLTQPQIAQSPQDQLGYTEKNAAVEALNAEVNDFFQKLADNLGNDFEALSKEAGYTVQSTELFEQGTPPEKLKARIEGVNIGTLADATFDELTEGDPDERLGNPYKTNQGWFILQLNDVQDSLPLSYEDAKVRVTVDLKKKLAREMMVEEAQALREKLVAAVESGQSFEEAAKAAEQTVEKKENLVAKQNFQGRSFGDDAFEPASATNPGQIAELELVPSEDAPEQALIIFVAKREVLRDSQYNTQLDNTFNNLSEQSRLVAFENWLNDRYKESEVVEPKLDNQ